MAVLRHPLGVCIVSDLRPKSAETYCAITSFVAAIAEIVDSSYFLPGSVVYALAVLDSTFFTLYIISKKS